MTGIIDTLRQQEFQLHDCKILSARVTDKTCDARVARAVEIWQVVKESQTRMNGIVSHPAMFSMLYYCGTCERCDMGLTKEVVMEKLFREDKRRFKAIRTRTEEWGASLEINHIPPLGGAE